MTARGRLVVVAGIVLLAFGLRAHRLDGQSLWSDESISLERSTAPLAAMISDMPVEHAPLYFVVLNGWLRAAGTGDFALRFPSLVFGVLAVALACALGRALFGWRAGALAAFLLAINPLHVWYGQEARMYTLVSACCLAALWAVVCALRTGSTRWWLAFSVACTAAVYSHYYGAVVPAMGIVYASGVILWLARTGRASGPRWSPRAGPARSARSLAFAVALSAVLFAPWLPRAVQVLGFPGWRPPATLADVATAFLVRFFVGPTAPPPLRPVAALAYVVLVALGAVVLARGVRRRRDLEGAWLLASGAVVVAAAVALVVAWKADVHERYFLFATPILYLTAARGLDAVMASPRRLVARSAWAVLLGIAIASAWSLGHRYVDPAYAKADYRGFTAHIVANAGAGDGLVLYGPGRFLTKRYGGDGLPKIYNLLSTANRDKTPAEIEELLTAIATEHGQVWLAVQGRDPGDVGSWFDTRGYIVEGGWLQGLQLFRYVFEQGATPSSSVSTGGGDAPELRPATGVSGQPGVRIAGAARLHEVDGAVFDLVDVEVRAPVGALPADARVSLRLEDHGGATVHHYDGALASGAGGNEGPARTDEVRAARVALPVPVDLWHDWSRVRAIIYRGTDLAPIAEGAIEHGDR